MDSIESVDVVIVGAGFAGLSAANYLSSKSIQCTVIEGRSRVGGRTLSQKILEETSTIDLGGQWIAPNQFRILSFIKQFNLDLIEQTWHDIHPNLLGQSIGLKPLTEDQLEKIVQINFEWDQMALELPSVEHALSYEKSSQWDGISVKQFIEEHPLANDIRIQQELKLQILTLTACDAEKVSLLYWLILIRSIPDGLKALDDGINGAQHYKICAGSQHVCFKLSLNENVRLNDPLKSVDYQTNDQILLTLNSNRQIKCRRLLLAFSPSLLSTIEFFPKLPSNCYCPITMGQCIKTIFIYSIPFWRHSQVNQCEKQGPCSNIFESANPIALIGLILGDHASFWTHQDENKLIEAITEQYALLFNTNEKPIHTFIQYWPKESLSRGCYAALYPPSSCSTWRNRKKALIDGKIWLASTEMALQWIGYIEGAIEAGQRFAQDIINSL
ncbi:unnamed protein product [Rotaria sp. Silwood1]|nr:unnamed protein product [Rotaria sp. Silwood1]CAF1005475.1 unnamed protein product [Rotaria sp. Silwood1]